MSTEAQATGERHYMSLRGATFLGVGSMVGAGIFALLGEAGAIAGAATWLSFLIAGLITGLLGYTMAKLGVRYPSSGGYIAYLREAFGNGHVLGVTAWLGFFTLVITASMVAVSFGSYAVELFSDGTDEVWVKVLAAFIVICMTAVNIRGSGVVDKAQTVIVLTVLAVFAVFIWTTLTNVDSTLLEPSGYPSTRDIVASVGLTFFAFLGFGVITFSAGDLKNPTRELPRAMYYAIGVATVVYVLVALGVFGTLTVPDVIANGSTAIAVAVEPSLGQFGFTLVSLAAMLATASCTNANLYGAHHLTKMLGNIGQFPESFSKQGKRGRPIGLMVTSILVLVMSIGFDLTAIASLGTTVALVLFLMLTISGVMLRHETGARLIPMLAAGLAIIVVLGLFVVETLDTDPATFYWMIALFVLAIACDYGWKYFDTRRETGTDLPSGGVPT